MPVLLFCLCFQSLSHTVIDQGHREQLEKDGMQQQFWEMDTWYFLSVLTNSKPLNSAGRRDVTLAEKHWVAQGAGSGVAGANGSKRPSLSEPIEIYGQPCCSQSGEAL